MVTAAPPGPAADLPVLGPGWLVLSGAKTTPEKINRFYSYLHRYTSIKSILAILPELFTF